MTQLLTANIGSYPRIGEDKDQQRHRRGLNHLQNKELSKHAFNDIEHSVIQEAVREQIETGIDEITDGHISWHDPISHFTRHLTGVKTAGLGRYFDNNFYYRIPVISSKPKRTKPILLDDFLFSRKISNKPVRVVMTGPYTLAQHTQSTHKQFQKTSARLDVYSQILREELDMLSAQGAKLIQIDEPSIGEHPEDIKIFSKAIEFLVKDLPHARIILATYFHSVAPILDSLANLPIDVLNIDFTSESKKGIEKILQSNIRPALGLGIINGRSTRMEPIDPILNTVKKWASKTKAPSIYMTPSCGLEYLPRMYAFAKLKLLSKIKEEADKNAKTA